MNLHKNKAFFHLLLGQAGDYYGVSEVIVEKDYYVTLLLSRIVDAVPHIIFKGGTSLSKCYHVIDRFSEDIDLCYLVESGKVTEGARKKVVKAIEKVIEESGLSLTNADEIRSRREFNKFIVDYPKLFHGAGLKNYLQVETYFKLAPFPTERKPFESMITSYLKETKRENLIEQFGLASFEVNVQALERTFIDKTFALCDYYLEGTIESHSRHIYDLYKMQDRITFDTGFKELVERVREERRKSPVCTSANDTYVINDLLSEIIDTGVYKSD